MSGVVHPTTSPEPMRSNLNCLNRFFNKHSRPRSGCPSLLVSFADSLCKQFVSDQDLQKTRKMYIPNVLTLIVFLKFIIDFEQKNQSADSKKACTITQRAKSEYILILTRGILFYLDISDIHRTNKVKILCLEAILVLSIFQV